MLTELFRNLIQNALKYDEAGNKHVEIDAEIAKTIGNSKVCVLYKNYGVGINPSFYNDIFTLLKRLCERDAYGKGQYLFYQNIDKGLQI